MQALIEKKLDGVIRSSQRVLPADKWVKQILHVFVASKAQHDAVVRVYNNDIAAPIKADTILLLTQTTGGGFIYCARVTETPTFLPPISTSRSVMVFGPLSSGGA